MVGQTCLECQYGPNGYHWCGIVNQIDEFSQSQPQPCGKPLKSAPKYRHEEHSRYSDTKRIQP